MPKTYGSSGFVSAKCIRLKQRWQLKKISIMMDSASIQNETKIIMDMCLNGSKDVEKVCVKCGDFTADSFEKFLQMNGKTLSHVTILNENSDSDQVYETVLESSALRVISSLNAPSADVLKVLKTRGVHRRPQSAISYGN